jgi:cob(I)alamin adenosyltransferase
VKIYTKRGDQGQTDLGAGVRSFKDSPAIEVVGALDELNSLIGLVRSEPIAGSIDAMLIEIQRDLFALGVDLTSQVARGDSKRPFSADRVKMLESAIDRRESKLPKLEAFILPSGCRPAALLHVVRTSCRRAERMLVRLCRQTFSEDTGQNWIAYLNRLSDLMFILARAANFEAKVEEDLFE